jgi:hypothetical protein
MTTTEAKADTAMAGCGRLAKSRDAGQAGDDLIDQLVAQAQVPGPKGWIWSVRAGCCSS